MAQYRRFDDNEFEDNFIPTVYSFTPSHVSRAASTQPSTHDFNKQLEKDEDDASGGGGDSRKQPDRGLPLLHVFESHYDGDHKFGGSHGVKLTAVQSSRLKYQPLFRWLHCTRNFMDFEDFSKEATRVPDLTAAEQKGIHDLLTHVQRRFVKSVQTANGGSVRHMQSGCIQHVLPPDSTSKAPSIARRTVTWVCLPYFTLEKYSGLQGAPGNPSAFPIETLLQAKFSRASKDRDMRQVVCQSKGMPTGLCFHVAQIWCLVLDNSFLFTYSRMAEETLRGESVGVTVKPIRDISNAGLPAIIAVSYRQSVLWCLPVEECQTWLDFLSHFREFFPLRLLFFWRKRPVAAEDWPRVWNTAKHVSDKIMLEMRIGSAPEPPPAGVLVPKDVDGGVEGEATAAVQPQRPPQVPGPSSRPVRGDSTSRSPSRLSILSCLAGVTRAEFDTIDEEVLADHLREVEDYLLSRTSFGDRLAYATCPEATRDEVYAILESQGVDLSRSNETQSVSQRDYETKLDIFNAADGVFKFFFPPRVNVPTTPKFWGALRTIITDGVPIASADGEDALPRSERPAKPKYGTIRTMRSELRGLYVELQTLNEIFAHSGRREQARIAVPKEIVEGWIHLLMSLIYLPKDHVKSDQLLDNTRALVHSGMGAVVRSLSPKSLLDNSVVLPLELLSLLSLKLLQDVTVGMPDISECYFTSLDVMHAAIASKRSDRSREYRISLLAEEISVVQQILGTQTSIFRSLLDFERGTGQNEGPSTLDETTQRTYHVPVRYIEHYPPGDHHDTGPTYVVANGPTDFKLASTDPGGYRVLLLNECLQFLASRERDFYSLQGWASVLERDNRTKIDTTKDRHDNAIYTFTIVTIIFLPLSAVASIFGMNTSDVRNMEPGQSAYWAVAIPVTVFVIFLGLLWTGELGSIARWFQSFGTRQKGYKYLPGSTYSGP